MAAQNRRTIWKCKHCPSRDTPPAHRRLHQEAPAEECEEYVFLTPQGRKVAHISDDLRALSKDFPTALGTIAMTATEMRKLTATNVAAAGSEELVRKVAAHMTHGEDTAKKYYRHIQGVAESVNKYEVTAGGVGVKRKAPEEEKENYYLPKMKKRIKWLPEEEEAIKKHGIILHGYLIFSRCFARKWGVTTSDKTMRRKMAQKCTDYFSDPRFKHLQLT